MSAQTPLFGADLQPCWFEPPPEREPDPLASLDMAQARRIEKRDARLVEKRRRSQAPTCQCEQGPWVLPDDDGDATCGRCGRWVL